MGLLDSFPHLCTIRRRIRAKDSRGGSIDTFLNEQTGVSCWEQNVSQKEVMEFEKRGMRITSKVYFTTDPSVGERHQILITSRNGTAVSSPTPLEVATESLPDATAGMGRVYKVFCVETTGEDD